MGEKEKVEGQFLVPMDEGRMLTVEEVRSEVEMIQRLMESVMREGEHYGKIPGCGDKPSLLKPGAEKLGLTFRVRPEFEIITMDLGNLHREEKIICRLYSIRDGRRLGEGVGTCSTMESKYQFRWDDTEVAVPAEYWQSRDIALLGGRSFSARKTWVNGKQVWRIFQRVEHDNPPDYYNTVLKMAKKRAHVDAIITYTAASDIFTQDLEDMVTETVEGESEKKGQKAKEETLREPKGKQSGAEATKEKSSSVPKETAQHSAIKSLCKKSGLDILQIGQFAVTQGILKSPKNLTDLTEEEAGKVISALQGVKDVPPPPPPEKPEKKESPYLRVRELMKELKVDEKWLSDLLGYENVVHVIDLDEANLPGIISKLEELVKFGVKS